MLLELCHCHMYGVEQKLTTHAKNEVYIPDLITPPPVTADWLYKNGCRWSHLCNDMKLYIYTGAYNHYTSNVTITR